MWLLNNRGSLTFKGLFDVKLGRDNEIGGIMRDGGTQGKGTVGYDVLGIRASFLEFHPIEASNVSIVFGCVLLWPVSSLVSASALSDLDATFGYT